MRKLIATVAASLLLVALAAPAAWSDVIWRDGFNDVLNWELDGLSSTLNGTSVTFENLDPFSFGTATRIALPDVLPWYSEARVTNIVLEVFNRPTQGVVLRLYADTYTQPVLDDTYKIESKIIQQITSPGTYVTPFTGFSWSTGSGGEVPAYVNFSYELADPPVEGLVFTADEFSYNVIPEPGTLLIGSVLAGLSGAGLRRKRRKATAA